MNAYPKRRAAANNRNRKMVRDPKSAFDIGATSQESDALLSGQCCGYLGGGGRRAVGRSRATKEGYHRFIIMSME
jgi:hypothetical protein